MASSSSSSVWEELDDISTTPLLADPNRMLFAFQKNDGSLRYVFSSNYQVGRVCLGLEPPPSSSGMLTRHVFEYIGSYYDDDRFPLILFAILRYKIEEVDSHQEILMEIFKEYVVRTCEAFFVDHGHSKHSAQCLVKSMLPFIVEECHDPGAKKIHYRLKLPSFVFQSISHHRVFWRQFLRIVEADQQAGDELALKLRVNDRRSTPLDTKHRTFHLVLGSSKNKMPYRSVVAEGKTSDYPLAFGQWLQSLILRPHAGIGQKCPQSWYRML